MTEKRGKLNKKKFKITKPEYKELPELYDMLWRSYEYHFKNSPPDVFVPYIENNPSYENENFFIIKYKDKIVASIQVFFRNVIMNKKVVLMGGIGQVATLPQFRGNGLAGLLLKETITYMKKKGVSFSLLFAGPVPLYEKYGWKELPIKSYSFSLKENKINVKNNKRYKIIKYTEKFKYSLFSIHENFIKNFDITILRNPVYWKEYVYNFKGKESETYLIYDKEKKKVVAYAILKKENQNIILYEYCSQNEEEFKFFDFLFNYIIKKFKPNEFYIPYGNKKYIPSLYLTTKFDVKGNIEKGFMVRDINSHYNWEKISKNALYFLSDAF